MSAITCVTTNQNANPQPIKTGYLGGYSFSLANIPGNIRKHAVALTALIVQANISLAAAGPMAYGICVEGCFLLFPPLTPICVVGCLPLLAAPTP